MIFLMMFQFMIAQGMSAGNSFEAAGTKDRVSE